MRLLLNYITQYGLLNLHYSQDETDHLIQLDSLFIFVIYQAGSGTLDANNRKLLEQFIRKIIKEPIPSSKSKATIRLDKASWPPEGTGVTMQDFYFNYEEGQWLSWNDSLPTIEPLESNSVFIDTVETIRLREFLRFSILNHQPFLIVGPSGTGKTLFLKRFFDLLPPHQHLIIKVLFTYQTQTHKVTEAVESKIERRRKGVFGPQITGQKCQIFVDDLNVPANDRYGVQPPIELLRQFCDYRGWYARDRRFIEVVDTNLICAMSPSGGGRNTISNRLMRHFNIQSLNEPDFKNLHRIYSSIMNIYVDLNYEKPEVNYEIKQAFSLTVHATIDIYNAVVQTLKPTPAKSHYLFNLRNIS